MADEEQKEDQNEQEKDRARRAKQEENLNASRWKKGQSGNPAGRPKKSSMQHRIRSLSAASLDRIPNLKKMVSEITGIDKRRVEKMDIGEGLIAVAFVNAMSEKGSAQFKELIEREDGKVTGAYVETSPVDYDPEDTVENNKMKAVAFYNSVLNSGRTSLPDKLKAQDNINHLLGLAGDAFEDEVEDTVSVIQEALKQMEERTSPEEGEE